MKFFEDLNQNIPGCLTRFNVDHNQRIKKKRKKILSGSEIYFRNFFARKCISFVIDGKIFQVSEFARFNPQSENIFQNYKFIA